MRLLASHTLQHKSGPRFLRLYQGDLSSIPAEETVDLVIVSAFPNDYVPSRTSLIGALYRRGVSVAALAEYKAADLRDATGCWVSQELTKSHPSVGFRRLLCFEPLTRGTPAEVVGDIFRAIVPLTLAGAPIRSVAMPVLAAGDQGNDAAEMLRALFRASVQWLGHGLPLETIKIVVYRDEDVPRLLSAFTVLSEAYGELRAKSIADETPAAAPDAPYDFFISYSREDSAAVDVLIDSVRAARPGVRVFLDRTEINPGDAWQTRLDEALEGCRKVIAVYSPSYFRSKVCMEEFNMARLRHRENDNQVIIPIYLRTADLKLYPRSLHYIDCREGDQERLRSACQGLVEALQPT
jgi:hypothetical protein